MRYQLFYFLLCEYREEFLPDGLPMFYRQSFIAFSELRTHVACDCEEVRKQPIWFNKNITSGGKPLFYIDWYLKGILFLDDILGKNNTFLTPEELSRDFGLNDKKILNYFTVRHSIPNEWKSILNNSNPIDPEYTIELGCPIYYRNNEPFELEFTNNKDLYWSFVSQKCKSEIYSVNYWAKVFDIDPKTFDKIRQVPYLSTRETKVQSLQYKILNLFYPCGLKLKQWKIFDSSKCRHCTEVDDILHHFCDCWQIKLFWNSLNMWWRHLCSMCKAVEPKDIILGFTGKGCHIHVKNFVLLCAKWFIYRTKYLEETCVFLNFLPELKSKILINRRISVSNKKLDSFLETWGEILDCL